MKKYIYGLIDFGRKVNRFGFRGSASEDFLILRFLSGPTFQKITSFQGGYVISASNLHHDGEETHGKEDRKHQDRE